MSTNVTIAYLNRYPDVSHVSNLIMLQYCVPKIGFGCNLTFELRRSNNRSRWDAVCDID